jgi:flagellar capping protein FliD
MKAAVNRSDAPSLEARLCEGEDTDTLWIVLRTRQSGTANAFRVYDVKGPVIRATGAGTVSEKPRDAMYVVDGTVCYSDSNRVYLDGGMVSVDLIGPGQAVLRIGPDRGKVEAAVHGLVEGVNGFFDFLEETANHILGEVQRTIRLLLKEHRAALESFGVKMNGDGHLHMDQDALKVLLAQGCSGIREALGDVDGPAARIGEFTERISTDSPLNYAREARQMSPDLEDYIHRTSAFLMKDIIQDTVFPRYHVINR